MVKDLEKKYSLLERVTLPYDPNFDKSNYKIKHIFQENGYLFISYAHRNGETHLFEIYKNPKVNLEKPDFIKQFERLKELEKKKEGLEEKIDKLMKLIEPSSVLKLNPIEEKQLKEIFREDPLFDFETQRFKKWYKRATIRVFYETIKFLGYEHEWDEISKMLPSVLQIPKEKIEKYCGKGSLMVYNRLFGELWSDKKYPSPFKVGAEIAHILKDYRNHGQNKKLNPLQKEYEEWLEKMIELHLMKESGYIPKRTSLSDKEIENLQIVMRFGPQDPHAGYYETDLQLLEQIENSASTERRRLLNYEGYREWIKENAKTRKKKFFTALNMLNVMAGTHPSQINEQKRNLKDMLNLLLPKDIEF